MNLTIKEILEDSINRLKQKKIQDNSLKAKIIISHELNVNKEYLLTHEEEIVGKKTIKRINKDICRLINKEAIQYIVQNQDFFGLSFFVNKHVLIPQPDTEVLVEKVIEIAKKIDNPKILDLCTGSGAIAISLKNKMPQAKITATDISKKALKIARINSQKNNVQIDFLKSDMLKNIKQKFNIIVSNPPYVKTKVIKTLDKEVQKEPHIALDGGKDGLKYYKQIIKHAYKYLENNGYLCLEIGYDQKEEVIRLIKENGNYKNIYSKKDYSGNDRIVCCNRK